MKLDSNKLKQKVFSSANIKLSKPLKKAQSVKTTNLLFTFSIPLLSFEVYFLRDNKDAKRAKNQYTFIPFFSFFSFPFLPLSNFTIIAKDAT